MQRCTLRPPESSLLYVVLYSISRYNEGYIVYIHVHLHTRIPTSLLILHRHHKYHLATIAYTFTKLVLLLQIIKRCCHPQKLISV